MKYKKQTQAFYQEDDRRASDEGDGSGKFSFVSTTVSTSRFIGVHLQPKLVDGPISNAIYFFWWHSSKLGVKYQVLSA